MRWRPAHEDAYCYLLGLYLGDGCISLGGNGSPFLRIVLDAAYPDVVLEAVATIRATFPGRRVAVHEHPVHRCRIVQVSGRELLAAFPQHGSGRKHTRPIVLEPWQRELLELHRAAFLRGLIHSDGCRTVNRFRTRLPSGRVAEYAYPRYFFSNLSPDIRALFCDCCDRLGIRWTQSNPRNISVSHRRSVALLDRFVGPKR